MHILPRRSFVNKLAAELERRFVDSRKFKDGWRSPLPTDPTMIEMSQCGYDEEAAIKSAMMLVWDHTIISYDRLATLWQQVRYLDRNSIAGDLVECGIFKGGAIGMMALAHIASQSGPVRRLHLFDSFEGLPEPQADMDGSQATEFVDGRASGALVTTGLFTCSADVSRTLLDERIHYPATLVQYHVGWFQETLPRDANSITDIGLLRTMVTGMSLLAYASNICILRWQEMVSLSSTIMVTGKDATRRLMNSYRVNPAPSCCIISTPLHGTG